MIEHALPGATGPDVHLRLAPLLALLSLFALGATAFFLAESSPHDSSRLGLFVDDEPEDWGCHGHFGNTEAVLKQRMLSMVRTSETKALDPE